MDTSTVKQLQKLIEKMANMVANIAGEDAPGTAAPPDSGSSDVSPTQHLLTPAFNTTYGAVLHNFGVRGNRDFVASYVPTKSLQEEVVRHAAFDMRHPKQDEQGGVNTVYVLDTSPVSDDKVPSLICPNVFHVPVTSNMLQEDLPDIFAIHNKGGGVYLSPAGGNVGVVMALHRSEVSSCATDWCRWLRRQLYHGMCSAVSASIMYDAPSHEEHVTWDAWNTTDYIREPGGFAPDVADFVFMIGPVTTSGRAILSCVRSRLGLNLTGAGTVVQVTTVDGQETLACPTSFTVS